MLKRLWNYIVNFFKTLNTANYNELDELREQYQTMYNDYLEMDKRTTSAKELKQQLENMKLRIDELNDFLYG